MEQRASKGTVSETGKMEWPKSAGVSHPHFVRLAAKRTSHLEVLRPRRSETVNVRIDAGWCFKMS
jgi:hypothetical protein